MPYEPQYSNENEYDFLPPGSPLKGKQPARRWARERCSESGFPENSVAECLDLPPRRLDQLQENPPLRMERDLEATNPPSINPPRECQILTVEPWDRILTTEVVDQTFVGLVRVRAAPSHQTLSQRISDNELLMTNPNGVEDKDTLLKTEKEATASTQNQSFPPEQMHKEPTREGGEKNDVEIVSGDRAAETLKSFHTNDEKSKDLLEDGVEGMLWQLKKHVEIVVEQRCAGKLKKAGLTSNKPVEKICGDNRKQTTFQGLEIGVKERAVVPRKVGSRVLTKPAAKIAVGLTTSVTTERARAVRPRIDWTKLSTPIKQRAWRGA